MSIKALEIAEEKQAVAQYGSSDSGASLGDIFKAAIKKKEGGEDKKDDEDDDERSSLDERLRAGAQRMGPQQAAVRASAIRNELKRHVAVRTCA